jgi:hypothetical protein
MLKHDLLKQFIPVAVAAAVAAVLVGSAVAKRGGPSSPTGPTGTTLTMTANYISWPQTWEPNCMTEDDIDKRTFTGSLNGSYSTSYRLCDLNTDGISAGGEGVIATVAVVGTLSDMTITTPDGTVRHAIQMSQSTYKGVTTTNYAVCWSPTYFLANDNSTNPLPGGTWAINLSGQISQATWTTTVTMTDVTWQQTYCPQSQQSLQ